MEEKKLVSARKLNIILSNRGGIGLAHYLEMEIQTEKSKLVLISFFKRISHV
jgi:hypothetical protein